MNPKIKKNIDDAITILEDQGLAGLVNRETDFVAKLTGKEGFEYVIIDYKFGVIHHDYEEFRVVAKGLFDDMCETPAYNKLWH